MIKNTLFLFLFAVTSLSADPAPMLPDTGQNVVIQNRILAKAHGKTFSVLDVAKKMEVLFARSYPQYANSSAAKYQYFSSHWKEILLQMVDHELILADAEKLDLKITDSEVRETLHDKFGPNLMGSLDALGLTYEEAKEMIHSELVVQKMTWFKVHSKALNAVNTQDIKSAYTTYCEKNPAKELWEYQVLSIRAKNEEIAQQVAQKVFNLCKQSPTDLAIVSEQIKTSFPVATPEDEYTITLSEELKLDTKSISEAHQKALFKLARNSISEPVKQLSRSDQSSVFRIFHLKNHTKTLLPTLRAMHETLQNELVQEAAEKESKAYIAKLRKRYGFDAKMLEETIPPGFQPFSLK
jgi:hypothetical protein